MVTKENKRAWTKKFHHAWWILAFKVVVEEGGAVEGLSESVEKYFLQIMLNEVLKICEK